MGQDIYYADSLEALKAFASKRETLGVVERTPPQEANGFFDLLMKEPPFYIIGIVSKEHATANIRQVLDGNFSKKVTGHDFYGEWIAEMAQTAQVFCDIQKTESIGYWVGSQRGCARYHIDNVPLRMLVTYAGMGTEWVPDEAVDKAAYHAGASNEKIVKDPSAIRFMNAWDVAVFRGGPSGLLHRTPDAALNGPSVLMRLDHPSFWDNILKRQPL